MLAADERARADPVRTNLVVKAWTSLVLASITALVACSDPRYCRSGDALCAAEELGQSKSNDAGQRDAGRDADAAHAAIERDAELADAITLPQGEDAGPAPCMPVAETCNGVDDDCDGHVDNGAVCARKQLVAGSQSTCLARADGTVSCWGTNDDGQLGDGTTVSHFTPAPSLMQGAAGLALSVAHVCALSAEGVVSCWGDNGSSQLSAASFPNELKPFYRATPTMVGLPLPAVSIAVGLAHSCAVLENGTVSCWGAAPVATKNAPQEIEGFPERVIDIASGWEHACALLASRSVVCWGKNEHGELGDGTIEARAAPVAALELRNIVQLAAGGQHACALSAEGNVWCWGFLWQRGITTATPTLIASAQGAQSIAVGFDHSCAVMKDGSVLCWGGNKVGELGDGSVSSRTSPVKVVGVQDVVEVALGVSFSCARTAAGAVSCWGNNSEGALGDGTMNNSVTPVPVKLDL